ncbi:hypothetical protein B7C51_24955 (plasmid) [Paenibacillus larvae subsp. pulvifaciens]|uniref:Uncharacterized protein n=1 Tax=Paenibacillus larvae subsp. pulvifaciens TaxID=1477 RepID=A0A1V0UZS3_9BACL|nr:hypothetical protein [Paenibacillus larvae]ARF70725.1 hypothetical protein B7C51_24955 [Paenibacillus larvae subsp. pulvifaciens]
MELIEERNGFKICEREEFKLGYFLFKRFVVFHRNSYLVWIDDFKNIDEARKFCDHEDANHWKDIGR